MTGVSIDPRGVRLESGRYYGELFTRVPAGHLRHMIANGIDQSEYAEAELKRRGTVVPTIEVTDHALDRASLKLWRKFYRGKDVMVRGRENEGLKSWVVRIGEDALREGTRSGDNVYYRGIRFVFEFTTVMPVLKSIMPRTAKGTFPRHKDVPRK